MKNKLLAITILLTLGNTVMADVTDEQLQTETVDAPQVNDESFMPFDSTYSVDQILQMSRQLNGNNKRAKALNQVYYNPDKSKIEALFGEIKVTYANKTDVIEINEVMHDLTMGYLGKDNKHQIACSYQSFKNFDLPVNSQFDYICVNAPLGMVQQTYFFNLDGNTIIKGGYVKGDQNTAATALMFGLLTPLTGLKVVQLGRYQSDYQNVSWVASNDSEYCLDITDEKWAIYPGFQALQCGKGFGQFSPANYVRDVMRTSLPNGFKFNWRVWSRNSQGKTTYGGNGYEGKVVVTQ
ncbi:MAG: hypothetical protein HOP02_00020 [Methylococcaceae bacterium]|nr:hypothetical protein [Methylococcaceae bacterium]